MKINLTEQQARAVAAAARAGLAASAPGESIPGIESISDVQSAFAGCDILDAAWKKEIGFGAQERD